MIERIGNMKWLGAATLLALALVTAACSGQAPTAAQPTPVEATERAIKVYEDPT